MKIFISIISLLAILLIYPCRGFASRLCNGGWGTPYGTVCKDSATHLPNPEYDGGDGYRIYGSLGIDTWEDVRAKHENIVMLLHHIPEDYYVILDVTGCRQVRPQDEKNFICYTEAAYLKDKWGVDAQEKNTNLLDPAVTEVAFAIVPQNKLPIYDSDKVKELLPRTSWESLQSKLDRVAELDNDHDGVRDNVDICPDEFNLDDGHWLQLDEDKDGFGDICDSCPQLFSPSGLCKLFTQTSPKPEFTVQPLLPGFIDGDGDGVANAFDDCPQDGGIVDAKGCPKDSDGDGIVDNSDQCPAVPGVVASEGCPEDESNDDGTVTNTDLSEGDSGSVEYEEDVYTEKQASCSLVNAGAANMLSIYFILTAFGAIAFSRKRQ